MNGVVPEGRHEEVDVLAALAEGGQRTLEQRDLTHPEHNNSGLSKGSRIKSYLFLVARPLRGGGGKGLATKKKGLFLKL